MSAVALAAPMGRRQFRALKKVDGVTPEEELIFLIAEQERDDTYHVGRSENVISLDAPAPSGGGSVADLIGEDEDGELIVLFPLPASPPLANAEQHGTIYGYMRLMCRCGRCKDANAGYMREYRAKRKQQKS